MGNALTKTKKTFSISVSPYEQKDRPLRWKVDVPVIGSTPRTRKFFETEHSAEIFKAKVQLQIAETGSWNPEIPSADGSARMTKLVKDYLESKEERGDPEAVRLIDNHLRKFLAAFGGFAPDDVPPLRAHQWLSNLKDPRTKEPLAQRTKHGIFGTCRTFYRWLTRYGFAKTNPFDRMEPIEAGDPPKGILTVDQMKIVLKICHTLPAYMRAWVVLGGFAGIRSIEITRMTWDLVNHETGEIHVPRSAIKKTKGVRERYVKILPACESLLGKHAESGKIIPVVPRTFQWSVVDLRRAFYAVSDGSKNPPEWPHDCLRHSFASYHLAMWESASATSHQLGHTSEKMVHQHYARAVTKKAAEAWWALRDEMIGEKR